MRENKMDVMVGGIRWVPFAVEFRTQEGVFSFHLYAVDMAHAIERLDELKQTATIIGELHDTIPWSG